MATALSPTVITREIDLSYIAPAIATTIVGLSGGATKGPVNELTYITTPQQYIDTFGEPTPSSYMSYAALLYLQRGNQLWINRVASEYGTDAVATATTDTPAMLRGTISDVTLFRGTSLRLFIDGAEDGDDGDILINFPSTVDSLADIISEINSALGAVADSDIPLMGWAEAANATGIKIYSATEGVDSKLEIGVPVGVTNAAGYITDYTSTYTWDKGGVTEVAINAGGTGYSVDDVLTITAGNGAATVKVLTIDTGSGDAVLTVEVLTAGDGYSLSLANATTVAPAGGTGCTLDVSGISKYAIGSKEVITVHPKDSAEITSAAGSPTFDFSIATYTGSGFTSPVGTSGNLVLNINGRGTISVAVAATDVIQDVIDNINDTLAIDPRYGASYNAVASGDPPAGPFTEITLVAPQVDASNNPLIAGQDPTIHVTANDVSLAVGLTVGNDPLTDNTDVTGNDGTFVVNMDGLGDLNIFFDGTPTTGDFTNPAAATVTEIIGVINNTFAGDTRYGATYNAVATDSGSDEVVLTSPSLGSESSSIVVVEQCLTLGGGFSPTEVPTTTGGSSLDEEKKTITFYAISPGSWANEELEIKIIDEDPLFFAPNTSTIEIWYAGNRVEIYRQVSLDINENRAGATYIETALGNGANEQVSAYVTVEFDNDSIDTSKYSATDCWIKPTETSQATTHSATGSPYELLYGDDGLTELSPADLIGVEWDSSLGRATGLKAFENSEQLFLNLLACPDGAGIASVCNALISICEARADCLAIIDPPIGLEPDEVVDWHNGIGEQHSAFNTSYGCLYGTFVEYYDSYNDQNIWLPPSCFILPVIAYNDIVAETWYAPAGLTRGLVRNALRLQYNPTIGQRDLMYGNANAVNPIVNFPQEGIVVWGQRTLQRVPSALDRINVRRMMLQLKVLVKLAARVMLFEPNDEISRARLVDIVTPIVDDIKQKRGIIRFQVVDATTDRDIQLNQMQLKVFLQPTQTIEVIDIPFYITAAGVSFG